MSMLLAACVSCRANIPLSQVEVRFQDLSVDADIAVGSSGLPSVYNTYKNVLLVRCPAMHLCACSAVPAPGRCWHQGPPSALPLQMQPFSWRQLLPIPSCGWP